MIKDFKKKTKLLAFIGSLMLSSALVGISQNTLKAEEANSEFWLKELGMTIKADRAYQVNSHINAIKLDAYQMMNGGLSASQALKDTQNEMQEVRDDTDYLLKNYNLTGAKIDKELNDKVIHADAEIDEMAAAKAAFDKITTGVGQLEAAYQSNNKEQVKAALDNYFQQDQRLAKKYHLTAQQTILGAHLYHLDRYQHTKNSTDAVQTAADGLQSHIKSSFAFNIVELLSFALSGFLFFSFFGQPIKQKYMEYKNEQQPSLEHLNSQVQTSVAIKKEKTDI